MVYSFCNCFDLHFDLPHNTWIFELGREETWQVKNYLEALLDGNYNWKTMYMRGTVIDEIVNAYEIEGTNQWTNYTFHHDNLQSVLGLSGHDGTLLQTSTAGSRENRKKDKKK